MRRYANGTTEIRAGDFCIFLRGTNLDVLAELGKTLGFFISGITSSRL
jgi:hypothetical protein